MSVLSMVLLGSSDGVSNNTTPVDVVAAPASSNYRVARSVTVFNSDTASATVTLQLVSGVNTRIIQSATLAVGQTFVFGNNMELAILDTTSKKLQIVLGGAITTNQLQWSSGFADYA